MSGNYILAASSSGNLEVIDVSNPASPSDIGHGPGASFVSSVGIANNYVYAASAAAGKGFYVFSFSGSTLTQVGNIPQSTGDGYNLALSGNTVFVPDKSTGVKIINVSNPNNPTQSTAFTDSGVFRQYNSVAVTENALAACGYPDGDLFGFYSIFDVSNPSTPLFAANPNLGAYIVRGMNGLAYVLSSQSNLVVDISTPSSPQLLKRISSTLVAGIDMSMSGSTLFSAGVNSAGQPRLVAIDVSNPSSPTIQGSKDFSEFGPGSAEAVSVATVGAKAIVGLHVDGNPSQFRLVCMDVSNLGAMVEKSVFANLPSSPNSIELSSDGNCAYVLCGGAPSSLAVLDVSQPASPILITNISLDSLKGTGTAIKGNELFVTTEKGLYVFNIRNEFAPIVTRSYVASEAFSVSVSNDSANQNGYIYVADSDGGVLVFKERDIEAPSVFITNPTFSSGYTNSTSAINLGGGSDDNIGVTTMVWANSSGGNGQISAPFDSWFVSGIPLYPGSNVLTVTAFDASGNAGSKTLMVYSQVPKQNQTITFSAISDTTYGAVPVTLTAAASSGLPVSFAVISGPASVSGNTLTLLGAGTVTVEASQAGNGQFNAASPVDVSFNVARAPQSVDFGLLPDKSADDSTFALNAVASSGLPVFFSVISGPANISSSNLTLVGSGSVTVLASQPGNSNFNAAATVQRTFNVTRVPQTIMFGALAPGKVGDAPFQLNATASSGLLVSYSVSGPAILSSNIVIITGYGKVTVSASQAGDSTYAAAANVAQSFIVSPPDNTLVALMLQKNIGFQFAFYGILNSNYTILASSNLLDWEPFANFTQTNSPIFLIDPAGTNLLTRFYRIAP